jgi:hypothetical protein
MNKHIPWLGRRQRFPGCVPALAAWLLSVPALAQAPAGGPAASPPSPPPPALADQFRDFCRNRPAGCLDNYVGQSDRFLGERATRAQEEERLRQQQHLPPQR